LNDIQNSSDSSFTSDLSIDNNKQYLKQENPNKDEDFGLFNLYEKSLETEKSKYSDGDEDEVGDELNDISNSDEDDEEYEHKNTTNTVDSNNNEILSLAKQLDEQLVFNNQNFSTFDFVELNYLISQNFDTKKLFKSHYKLFRAPCLINQKFFNDLFINSEKQNILFILSIIRDKCYQSFIEHTQSIQKNVAFVKDTLKKRLPLNDSPPMAKDEAWEHFIKGLSDVIISYVAFTRELPGFNILNKQDFMVIINFNIPFIIPILISNLFINNESYINYNNKFITKKYMDQFFGLKISNYMFDFHRKFNNLSLTNQEIALLIPFILTSSGN
jgi:hypothetical protein